MTPLDCAMAVKELQDKVEKCQRARFRCLDFVRVDYSTWALVG
jgi:hypothetical protein